MGRIRKRRRRCRVESLESRHLLAAELLPFGDPVWKSVDSADWLKAEPVEDAVVSTHHYFDNGKPVAMVVLSDRMAVRWNDAPFPALPRTFRELRRAGDTNVVIYAVPNQVAIGPNVQDMVRGLDAFLGEVPVFQIDVTKSEAVVLDEIIVSLKPGVDAEAYFESHEIIVSAKRLSGTPNQYVATVRGGHGVAALEAANLLDAQDRNLEWSTPNLYQNWQRTAVPNDPFYAGQWHLNNTGQSGAAVGEDSSLEAAWDVNFGGSADILVGVIDDGVSVNHPDLLNYAIPGEIPGDGIDNDGNGWIDDVNGWNFVNNNNDSGSGPQDPHGTSVAGVAAARGNNGIGVAAPAFNSPVISGRIFASGSVASDANIAASIYYMAGRTEDGTGTWRSADVVNNSWGGGGPSSAIQGALQWANANGREGEGTLYLFASGNGFSSSVILPAAYSTAIPNVVAVGASNSQGERSNYSNFGAALDIVSPSNDTRGGYLGITTTDIPGSTGYSGSDYTSGFGGTSSATPLASGIMALALDELDNQNISLSPAELRDWLRTNTVLMGGVDYDIALAKNTEFGYGRLDAGLLLESIGQAEISITTTDEDLIDDQSIVDFGEAIVGQRVSQTLRIRNQGTETLNLGTLSSSDSRFSISQPPLDTELALGEWTTFSIDFLASGVGEATGEIQIQSNDSDESIFEIPVRSAVVNASISGVVFEDHSGDAVRDPGEREAVRSTVFLDLNGDGQLTQEENQFSASPGSSITDGSTTNSSISVPSGVSASQLEVTVNIEHTYVGDLTLRLTNPDGDSIILSGRQGGSGNNYSGTVFDDAALTPISVGSAPFSGRFRPQEALAGLLGGELAGNWTLAVTDSASQDQGTLNSWSLDFRDVEPEVETDASGFYAFVGLDAGTYDVGMVVPQGWDATGSTSSEIVLANSEDFVTDVDFAIAKENRVYVRVYDDVNADGAQGAAEFSLPNQTVFYDLNSNGLRDTGVESNFLSQPNQFLSDTATTTVTQLVSGVSNPSDLNVRIDLTHTWVSDLIIRLISPEGENLTLVANRGGSGDNFTDTVFDDQASASINIGSAPFTGSFRPSGGSLSSFLSSDVNGEWSLSIQDVAGGDVGRLLEWELEFEGFETSAVTDSYGNASLDVNPSLASIVLLPTVDRAFTEPSNGQASVTTNNAPSHGMLFGSRRVPVASVEDRGVFYHNATGGDLSSSGDAESARDTSKVALVGGVASSTANYTNYDRGINGLLFDIENLPSDSTAEDLEASLQFATWNGIAAEGFTPLPSETVPTVELVGIGGDTTRVKVTFPDRSITNTWLRITVPTGSVTGLANDDVFYFGNVIGDLGVGNTSSRIRVNAVDTVMVRANQSLAPNSAAADNPHDINRDGRVNAIDTVLVRANQDLAGSVAPFTPPSS